MRLPSPNSCGLNPLLMPLLLLLSVGCEGQGASDFWEVMGMLFVGLLSLLYMGVIVLFVSIALILYVIAIL